jgi:hypothetical protein
MSKQIGTWPVEVGKAKQAHWVEQRKSKLAHRTLYSFFSALCHALVLTNFMRLRHSTENYQRCRSERGRRRHGGKLLADMRAFDLHWGDSERVSEQIDTLEIRQKITPGDAIRAAYTAGEDHYGARADKRI